MFLKKEGKRRKKQKSLISYLLVSFSGTFYFFILKLICSITRDGRARKFIFIFYNCSSVFLPMPVYNVLVSSCLLSKSFPALDKALAAGL